MRKQKHTASLLCHVSIPRTRFTATFSLARRAQEKNTRLIREANSNTNTLTNNIRVESGRLGQFIKSNIFFLKLGMREENVIGAWREFQFFGPW